jgi:uncharacterized membrane protein YphA (DoxX/SURF4 family)
MNLVLRLLLGIVITAAGLGKLLDIEGFASVIETYKLRLPQLLRQLTAGAVTLFELALGVVLLSGRFTHEAALWSAFMHGGYFILLSISLFRKLPLKNCGCFGVFLARPLRWYTPLEDLVLIVLSFLLACLS